MYNIYLILHTHTHMKSLNVFKHVFQIVKSYCLNEFFGYTESKVYPQ